MNTFLSLTILPALISRAVVCVMRKCSENSSSILQSASDEAVRQGQMAEQEDRQAPIRERLQHSCLKHRIMIMTGIVVLLICLVTLACYLPSPTKSEPIKSSQPLISAVPLFSYVPIEESVNFSVDPCTDFYEFTCGKWTENMPLTVLEKSYENPFSILQSEIDNYVHDKFTNTVISEKLPHIVNSAIQFYYTCLEGVDKDIEYSEGLQYLFSSIGEWPMLMGDVWDESEYDPVFAIATLKRIANINAFVNVFVMGNRDNSTYNAILIKRPHVPDQTLSSGFSRFLLYVVLNGFNSTVDDDIFLEDFYESSMLEQSLIDIMHNYSNTKLEIKNMTVSELNLEVPGIDWLYFLQVLTNETLCPLNKCIKDSDRVCIGDIEYLKHVTSFFGNWSKRAIANTLGWFVVRDYYILIPGVFREYGEHFGTDKSDIQLAAEKQCFMKVKEAFSQALDYLFIKSKSEPLKEDGSTIVRYLKQVFREQIKSSAWLDDHTKSGLLLKLDHMLEIVGYPKYYVSDKYLAKIYRNPPIMGCDSLKNYLLMMTSYTSLGIERLANSSPKTWHLPRDITDVSAYYILNHNVIVFPLSLQNPPFYYTSGPSYLNFGAIGSIIGHEMNHAFDNQGYQRDGKGNVINFWTNNSIENLQEKLNCFKKQFDSYTYDAAGVTKHINGTTSVGENMADTSGLHQAYLAYKEWENVNGIEEPYSALPKYSSDQLFFMGYASLWCLAVQPGADPTLSFDEIHIPPRIRVLGTISNSEHFAKAFNCPIGSPMNPPEKCSMW